MKRTNEAHTPSFWRMMILLVLAAGLALIAWLLFNPNRTNALGATELPVSLHSGLVANYSADLREYVVPAVRMELVEEALADAAAQEEQVSEVLQNLETPVPTVTPQRIYPTATPQEEDDEDDQQEQKPAPPTAAPPAATATSQAKPTQVAPSSTSVPPTQVVNATPTSVKPTATQAKPTSIIIAPSATKPAPTATSQWGWPYWTPRWTPRWWPTSTPVPPTAAPTRVPTQAPTQPPAPTSPPPAPTSAPTSPPPAPTSEPVQPTSAPVEPTPENTRRPRWWPTRSSYFDPFYVPDERAVSQATLPVAVTGTQTPQTSLWSNIESFWQRVVDWLTPD